MTFKRYFLMQLQIYFLLVSLIFAVSMVLGVIFSPNEPVYYSQFRGPFILAGLCVLPSFVTYYKDEPSVQEYIIRHFIQLVMIEAIVLFMIEPPENVSIMLFRVLVGISVFIIYVITKALIMLQKYKESIKLTKQLKEMQLKEV